MWESAFGIPDHLFMRGDVPMTKEEIRAISLSKMRLKRDSTVWDIGAGTGAVSIEAALYCNKGRVYAVEKKQEARELIRQNAGAFGVGNLIIVPGEAAEVILELPEPDRVFIGGTGDMMEDIFEIVTERISKGGIIVVNSITLETAYFAQKFLACRGFEVETILVSIAASKKAGGKTMMLARNPVYIITAVKV